ncbi:MAG: DEAD/DEAH box helicase [Saprospiraceae bacterium]
MFLNNAIHQYIKEIGLHPLAKIGADLVKQDRVSHPLHQAKLKSILLEIDEESHVVIHYLNAFKLDKVFCNCGENLPCEHIFAGLYYLLEIEDKTLVETLDIPSAFTYAMVGGKESEYESLPTYPLNEFRKIDVRDANTYQEFLIVYKPPFLRNFTSLAMNKIVLKKEKLLQCHLSEKHYFEDDRPEKVHIVYIIKTDTSFQIKCNSCQEKSFSVCIHQYESLKHHDIKFILFEGKIPDFIAEVRGWARKMDIVPEKFIQLYEIVIENQKTKAVLVNLNFYTAQKLFKLQTQIDTEFYHQNGIPATDQQDENNGDFGNAVLWNDESSKEIVLLLKGKMDKLGDEFLSKIEMVSFPEYFSSMEKNLWYSIERFTKENGKDSVVPRDRSWNRFLKLNLGEINQVSHYIPLSKLESMIFSKRNLKKVTFSPHFIDVQIKVEQDEAFYRVKAFIKINETIINPKEKSIQVMPYFLIIDHEAFVYKHPELGRLFSLLGWEEILVDTAHSDQFKSLLYSLNNVIEVQYPNTLAPHINSLENPRWKIKIKEKGSFLLFEPILEYGDVLEVTLPVEKWLFTEQNGPRVFTIPEDDVEKFTQFMVEQHEQFEANIFHHGSFYIHYKDYLHENWFLQFFEKCRDNGIDITGHAELDNFKMNTYKPSIKMGLSSGIDWFNVDVDMVYGDQKVSAKAWLDALRKNEKYILLSDGSLGMIPEEWFHTLKRLSLVAYEEKGQVKLNHFHFNVVSSLFQEIEDEELYRDIKNKISILGEYDFQKKHSLPEHGNVTLRDYQKLGFQWLKSLSELGFGGCLADDMGLGKTLQVLTLLADQKKLQKNTSLIVVPRSLLFNWACEIDKFFPDITYVYYHGTERVLVRPTLFNFDIVITTYDTATNDIEFLKELPFNYAILDESQAIKNPESKRYKAMRLLKSDNKIAITGTPIENNTFDLFAQFSFVNPGIFGSVSQFKTNFAVPIDKENDRDSAYMLRKLIHPFLLRRTKAQVASDLPERSESILYCEMGDTQRAMYEEFRLKIKSEIEDGVQQVGIQKMRIKVIEGLLRLRQICNSPRLIDQNLPNHLRQSVKIETLLDIIENDLGDHHALVYSQFTSMLALVRSELDKRNIPYAYLDGSTRDRQGAVNMFMDNKEVKLFLISLKAGNTGLNLVKADYVYILDPWWNPAVEAQAIDRTHRIGQDKNVFAYKMICRNTIEEKIIKLQERKKQLATDLIITDEHVFKSLNNEDLVALFN